MSDLKMPIIHYARNARAFMFFGLVSDILGPSGQEKVLIDGEFSQKSKFIEKTTIFGQERGARGKKRARTRAHQMLQMT